MKVTLDERFLLMRAIISEIRDIKEGLKAEIFSESLKKDYETELAAYESLLKKLRRNYETDRLL